MTEQSGGQRKSRLVPEGSDEYDYPHMHKPKKAKDRRFLKRLRTKRERRETRELSKEPSHD